MKLFFIALFYVNALNLTAQTNSNTDNHIMVLPGNIKWTEGPLSLSPGAKKVLLEGDPKDSGLFTMRLQLPANYKIMPHRHTADEHVTVIEGVFYMGIGEKFDEKQLMEFPAGGFTVMPTGTAHFGVAKQPCIIQIHGIGPWTVTYINAADDPRKNK